MNISIICPTVPSAALKKLPALLNIGVAAIAAAVMLKLLTNFLRPGVWGDGIGRWFSVEPNVTKSE